MRKSFIAPCRRRLDLVKTNDYTREPIRVKLTHLTVVLYVAEDADM